MSRFLLALLVSCGASLAVAEETKPELMDYVVQLLHNSDAEFRAIALEEISYHAPGQAATQKFAATLPSLSNDTQVALLRALAVRSDRAAKSAVLKALAESHHESVRVAAIETLGDLAEDSELQLLVRLLSSQSSPERKAARASLVRVRGGNSLVKGMAGMLQAQTPAVQIELIGVLAERRSRAAFPELLQAAVGDNPSVRRAAMKALGEIGKPDQIEGMVAGVLKAKHGSERSDAEKAVMRVCSRIQAEDNRADPLLAAIERRSPADQVTLLSALARIGGAAALGKVEQAIASGDSAMHAAGIRALSNWPDASVAPQLIELATHDEHDDHRLTVLRALIRVAPLADGRTDEQKLALLKSATEMCRRDEERQLALERASAIRTVESLRFVLPFVERPEYAEQACLSVVELAHHRELRDDAKEEFHAALDKVIATSSDPVVVDRANRYKQGKTWNRPRK